MVKKQRRKLDNIGRVFARHYSKAEAYLYARHARYYVIERQATDGDLDSSQQRQVTEVMNRVFEMLEQDLPSQQLMQFFPENQTDLIEQTPLLMPQVASVYLEILFQVNRVSITPETFGWLRKTLALAHLLQQQDNFADIKATLNTDFNALLNYIYLVYLQLLFGRNAYDEFLRIESTLRIQLNDDPDIELMLDGMLVQICGNLGDFDKGNELADRVITAIRSNVSIDFGCT